MSIQLSLMSTQQESELSRSGERFSKFTMSSRSLVKVIVCEDFLMLLLRFIRHPHMN